MKNISILLCLFLLNISLSAQGWEKTYPINSTLTSSLVTATKTTNGNILIYNESYDKLLKINQNGDSTWISLDEVGAISTQNFSTTEDFPKDHIISNSDGTFLTIDDSYQVLNNSLPGQSYFFQLIKYDALGDTIWTKRHQLKRRINDVKQLADNHLIALSNNDSTTNVTKFNQQNGTIIWDITLAAYPADKMRGFDIVENNDGTFMVYGEETANNNTLKTYFFAKLNSSGNLMWKKTYVSNQINTALSAKTLAKTNNGEYIITRKISDLVNLVDSNYVMKFDAQGNEVWRTLLGINNYKRYSNLEISSEGDIIIVGESGSDAHITKVSNSGNILWEKSIFNTFLNQNSTNKSFQLTNIIEFDADNFMAVGTYTYHITTTFDQVYHEVLIVKFDALGNTKTNVLQGNVFNDANFDCSNNNEDPLGNVMVQLLTPNTDTFYQYADAQGNYTFDVETGNYTVSVIPHHSHWQACPPNTFNFPAKYDTINQDLGLQPYILCPDLTVDISVPVLVRCFSNEYVVNYSNIGTAAANNSYIEVNLDAFLTVDSISIPFVQNGNTYIFNLGTVGINQSGSFIIHTTVNCNAVLGQTHCAEAVIFPNEICLPNNTIYQDAEIIAKIDCQGSDSIKYQIRNIGDNNMVESRQYYVIEDQILQNQSGFKLNSGSDTSWVVAAINNVTYRLEAEQDITHPFPNQIISDFIFGCDTVNATILNVPINQFPLNDYDSNSDIHCTENVGAYDPNDKQGFPVGYGTEHYINQNQSIEYLIRFQNTGTYLAFNVRVEDEIDTELLDLSTLKILSSSHNYQLEIIDGNTLNFLFLNIMLPDSNSNEPESHGFIRFEINQKANNPLGSIIENSADIYFDFNAPIITNTTFHTIGENFIDVVSTQPIQEKRATVNVFPNPFTTQATFEIETEQPYQNVRLTIYNIMGQTVKTVFATDNNRIILDRDNLTSGIYFYQIQSNNLILDSGKLMVQ